jgi:hypothetical protein
MERSCGSERKFTGSHKRLVLAAIVATVVLALSPQWSAGTEVGFRTANTVAGTFDGAISVYAADVDGDGDLDVLGAGYYANAIRWWENTAGDGSAWTEHTENGTDDGA